MLFAAAWIVIPTVSLAWYGQPLSVSSLMWSISSDGSRLASPSIQDTIGHNAYNDRKVFITSIGSTPSTPTPLPTPVGSQKIIFTSDRLGSANNQIFTMDPNGSNQAPLPNPPLITREFQGAISPDGTKIAFTDGDDIYIMNSDGSQIVDLTNDPNIAEEEPRFSPDGSKITYVAQQSDGTWDVYLMQSDGTNRVNLTHDLGTQDLDPTFSPDGTTIAFTSDPGGWSDIYTMDTTGGNLVNLTQQSIPFGIDGPTYSADGTKIAYSSYRDPSWELFIMDSNGSNQTQLTHSTVLNGGDRPTFSPDGTQIAYVSESSGNLDIWVIGSDGNNPMQLTTDPENDFSPFWWVIPPAATPTPTPTPTPSPSPSDITPPVITPNISGTLGNNGWYTGNVQVSWSVVDDESTIINTSGCGSTTVNTDSTGITLTCMATSAGGTGSNSVTIKHDATPPTLAPTVSPNPVVQNAPATATPNASDALSGIASQSCQSVDTSIVGNHSVQCTATDNAGNIANASANYLVSAPSSGIDIVFTRTLGGSTKIWGMKVDGTGQVQLTTGSEVDATPCLSPDKSKIVFSRVVNNALNYEIFSMNLDGTGLTRLTNSSGLDYEPVWSPDGNKIAFTSDRYSSFLPNYEILVMDAKGTNVTRLTNSPGIDWNPAWSPDGTRIAFSTSRYSNLFNHFDVATMNSGDGSFVNRVTNNASIPYNLYPSWSPDGSRIAFTNVAVGSFFRTHSQLYAIDASGVNLTRVTNDPANDSEPAWGANGKILFVSDRSGGSQIFGMDAGGTKPTQLTNSGTNRSPSW